MIDQPTKYRPFLQHSPGDICSVCLECNKKSWSLFNESGFVSGFPDIFFGKLFAVYGLNCGTSTLVSNLFLDPEKNHPIFLDRIF